MDRSFFGNRMSEQNTKGAGRDVARFFACHVRIGIAACTLVPLATFLLAGCSSEKSTAPVFPVTGKVSFEGEPANGAFVVFHPKAAPTPGNESSRPSAQVQADGSFKLTTHSQADGAPAGDYAVTVQWNKLVKQGGDTTPGPNVIPPVYSKPDTTPLKVTVNQSSNELTPFQITKK